jgi:hypothetical protein
LQWASAVDDHRSSLGRQLHSVPWHGQSADRFRADWNARYSPSLANWVASMRAAAHSLQVQAQQQRAASSVGIVVGHPSGAPVPQSGGFLGWVHGRVQAVEHDTQRIVHTVSHDVGEVVEIEREGLNSQAFAETLDVMRLVAVAAAFVPVVGPAVSLGLGAVVLLADVAQMANTDKWNAATLAEDGLTLLPGIAAWHAAAVATSAAKVGEVGLAAQLKVMDAVSDGNILTGTVKGSVTVAGDHAITVAPQLVHEVVVARSIDAISSTATTTYEVAKDLQQGNFVQATLAATGYLTTGLSASGAAGHGGDVISVETSAGNLSATYLGTQP